MLPLLIVFTITSVETVGDVTATEEISQLEVDGERHVRRIRGGMLNDGISGAFSALAGSLPLTTFAQVRMRGGGTAARTCIYRGRARVCDRCADSVAAALYTPAEQRSHCADRCGITVGWLGGRWLAAALWTAR